MNARTWQTLSAGGTLVILAWVPTNIGKLLALVACWALTFRPRPSRRELTTFVLVNLLFTALNARALQNGIFAFAAPDLLGLPWWELVMWGFYVAWARRVVGGPRPVTRGAVLSSFSLAFALPFGLPLAHATLFGVTLALLCIGMLLFHDKHDVAMVAVMVLLGAAIEYTGVLAGLWSYPSAPPGGVPPWFITMWAGVGLVSRRLLPFIEAGLDRRLMVPRRSTVEDLG